MLPGHLDDDAERCSLHTYARTLPAQATSTATVRLDPDVLQQRRQAKREGSTEPIGTYREAQLCLVAAPVRLVAPHVRRGNHGKSPLKAWIIRIWEPNPPAGCEPVEWLLLTNHPVETPADIRRVKTWHEWRWVVEEYHKAQKSGCAMEKVQLRDESRDAGRRQSRAAIVREVGKKRSKKMCQEVRLTPTARRDFCNVWVNGMASVTSNPLLGLAMHAVGATFPATCLPPVATGDPCVGYRRSADAASCWNCWNPSQAIRCRSARS